MKFSILIPHYRTGKASAYCISQLLKYKSNHELDIIVIDNHSGDGSIEYLSPFLNDITILIYPTDKLQSHGIAQDFALQYGVVKNEIFITVESDSFPTSEKYFDMVQELVNDGYDCGGALLKLSGGEYLHGCGAFYKKSLWDEAKKYCEQIPYKYFPNMSMKNGFASHTLIHNSILDNVLNSPNDWVELSNGYNGLTKEQVLEKADYYSPIMMPFHNGTGGLIEDVRTYGNRNTLNDAPYLFLNDKSKKIIFRIGYEPSQFMSYFSEATKKKICYIPTEIKWMKNRGQQQQEYTLMGNCFKHLWAGSSYLDMKDTALNDVYEFKKNQIEELYNSLPEQFKIK